LEYVAALYLRPLMSEVGQTLRRRSGDKSVVSAIAPKAKVNSDISFFATGTVLHQDQAVSAWRRPT
jgi:hypothetical protein